MRNRTRIHRAASRLHRWLALFAGLQILLWFASGAYMSFMPIETVRGEHLVDRHATPALTTPIDLSGMAAALARKPGVRSVELLTANGRNFALLRWGHGKTQRIDPATGAELPPLRAAQVAHIALAAWKGTRPTVRKVRWLKSEPGDYRGDLPVWQVQLADPENSRVYIAPDSGKIMAVRTDRWRIFDLMWGLHIMDWKRREDSNSVWLFAFAVAALFLACAGMALLVIRWPRRRRSALQPVAQ